VVALLTFGQPRHQLLGLNSAVQRVRAFNKLCGTQAVATRHENLDVAYKGTIDDAPISLWFRNPTNNHHETRPNVCASCHHAAIPSMLAA